MSNLTLNTKPGRKLKRKDVTNQLFSWALVLPATWRSTPP